MAKGKKKLSDLLVADYEKIEKGGDFTEYSRYFDGSNISKDIKMFKLEQSQIVDILPFKVGKNHPDVVKGVLNEGDEHYVLTINVHRGIGPTNENILCPTTYGKNHSCSICDAGFAIGKEKGWDNEEGKALRPKIRTLFVMKIIEGEDAGEIKIFDTWHTYFKGNVESFLQKLLTRSKTYNRDGSLVEFCDIENGSSLRIVCNEVSFEGRKRFEVSTIDFLDREVQYTESILDETPSLDKGLIRKSAEEIEAILNGVTFKEDDFLQEGDVNTVNEDDDVPLDAKDHSQVESESDQSQVEASLNKENLADSSAETTEDKCPHGHVFGVDADMFSECLTCDKLNACSGV